ncbi:MAG: hypothetical protein Q8O83_02380 [bacterium]|nr:hypothetical protein [bacterium]
MVNSRIEEIEKEEGSGAINLYPLAKGDDGRTIRMRWTSRSDGGLGEFHFVAVLVFGYQSDEDRRVSDEDRRVFDGQCGGGYKPYGEVL